MIELNFTVENQLLNRIGSKVIVNKSKNLICNFSFKTDEWLGIDKFAIFKDDEDVAYNIYLGTDCDCSCTIPNDVLNGDLFKISVYGGNLITTTEKTVILLSSGYTTDIQPVNDTGVDVFSQIFSSLNNKIDNVSYNNGLLSFKIGDRELVSIPIELDNKVDVSDISAVALSGDYTDLTNIPSEFNPIAHGHNSEDIIDLSSNIDNNFDDFLDVLIDEIRML